MTILIDPAPGAAPRPLLLRNLTAQTHLIAALFTLLSSPQPNALSPQLLASLSSLGQVNQPPAAHPAQAIYALLVQQVQQLDGIVDAAYEHQEAYAGLMAKRAEVVRLEKEVRAGLRALERGRMELEEAVMDGKKVVAGMEAVEERPISSATLLATAQNLAAHSAAPVSSLLAPQDKAQYMPWPTEGAMRAGLLFMMGGGSMSGMGDTGKIGDENHVTRMPVEPSIAHQVVHEEDRRRYDPDAVFDLGLNSDSDDDDD